MRITITGINFNYDNGFDKECTSVDVNYITSGIEYSSGSPVQISHEQYEATKEDKDKLRTLVADKIIENATTFIEKVTEYKDSLQAEE